MGLICNLTTPQGVVKEVGNFNIWDALLRPPYAAEAGTESLQPAHSGHHQRLVGVIQGSVLTNLRWMHIRVTGSFCPGKPPTLTLASRF